jgi:hypothetical protein
MPTKSSTQKVTDRSDQNRTAARDISRYEVRGLERDKALVRRLAARLAASDTGAQSLRADLASKLATPPPQSRGGIYSALRRSPMVGADLDLNREKAADRDPGL